MSWYNKVTWSEGLFLRPQLFQQQERYLEHFVNKRATPLSPFFFGFSHCEIDTEALALGKVLVKSASGVFGDGTPFDMPGSTPPPAPLTIRQEHLEQVIYLAVPIRVPNGEETTFDNPTESLARYAVFDADVRDANSVGHGFQAVQLSRLRLRLLPRKELADAWIGLPLTRVKTLRADGSIELDETLVPPVSGFGASKLLASWLGDIHDLTRMRADRLAQRLTGDDGQPGSVAEVSDYLLLQTLNRYEPLLQHLRRIPTTSPAELYALLTSMAGELSTYVRPSTRRPLATHPPYQHEEPYLCLKPLVEDTQWLLNAVLVRSAQSIALHDASYGMRNAVVDPAEMRSFTALVLAVSAQMPPDALAHQFATQAKVAPSERLPDLVRAHLPGIPIQAMPVAPRQIPFNSGYVYFEILRNGPLWELVEKHGGIALHVAGEFPSLQLQLWGVRG
ncbi:type VI secretion system baseplate subunit TssK [Paraburkholderia sp. Tr-20389]|uniref:type VI secretion system baseplate subunit TssK n=1 Tax=Paraburkholderia sp. Tr-20389 TaxID=2703903 RepID=UPI00197E67F8|nr:type VI secretion system baseplate subunit TssK [Paraburkholderia sp. Tr-20389]MBN3752368.1 type VI secretion system baseplate subunit TssK [Paraburkholderia sp. Tr-20389]